MWMVGTAALVALPAIASAHTEIEADGAVGDDGALTTTVTVEEECSGPGTKKFELFFPTTPAIDSATPGAVTGWVATVDKEPGSGAVTNVTWEGAPDPGVDSFDLPLALATIPTNTESIAFKATQTCATGEVIRWVEPTTSGGPEPENPAPVLVIKRSATGGAASTTTTSAPGKQPDGSDDSTGLAIGIAVGAAVIIGGGAYLLTRRRK